MPKRKVSSIALPEDRQKLTENEQIIESVRTGKKLHKRAALALSRMKQLFAFTASGATRQQAIKHFSAEWNLTESAVYSIFKSTEEVLGSIESIDKKYAKAVQIARLEKLYQKALLDGNNELELDVIKEINKITNLYEETAEDKNTAKLPSLVIFSNNQNILINGD